MHTKYSKNIIQEAVFNSESINQVLIKLGLKICGGNHSHIKKIINFYDIDTSHFLGMAINKGKRSNNKHSVESFLNNVMIKNGPNYTGRTLKAKLIEFNLKKDICEICGQIPFWNNKKLSLQIDHINGDHFDNRMENIRIVCPNCHTQTETFSVRNSVRENNLE